MLNKSQWNTIIVISQQQMIATSIPSHSLSCFSPCSLFRPQYSRRVFKGLLCVLLAPGFPVQDQIWDYIAVNINPREIRYVCLADHVSVCLYERLWLVWPGYWEGLFISGSNPAGFFLHVEPCQRTLSDGQISGLEGHLCVCVFVWFPEIEKAFDLSLLFTFWKQFRGVNTAVAGTCVQDCTQYVRAASVLGEVQECEIRWWFVEGDNEQNAILTGWAFCCNVRICYTLSDFNHCMLFC